MHCCSRALCVVGVLVVGASCSTGRRLGQLRSWDGDGGDARQVVAVTARVPLENPVVELTLSGPAGAPLRVATEEQPHQPLPIFEQQDARFLVTVPGQVQPGRPRYLVATWSGAGGLTPSPRLAERPLAGDDYATLVNGDAWDFNEGDQEGIAHWGDSKAHYGNISVRDGVLVVRVTGSDPYLIWGTMFGQPDPATDLHIDSALYTTLSMRVRQSCEQAKWSLYLTDASGKYEKHDFDVRGKEFQELTFDLQKLFEGFWDGRGFRALRIDTTNHRPGTTVEIDWVRLTRPPAHVEAGPTLSSDDVARRASVRRLRVTFPSKALAGERLPVEVVAADGGRKPVEDVPIAVTLHAGGQPVASWTSRDRTVTIGVGTRVGVLEWEAGLCGDLGRPAGPVRRGSLTVAPAALDHYELIPERRVVRVAAPQVTLTVWGADRFGNRIAVDLRTPQWSVSNGGEVAPGPLRGAPASATVACARQPRTTHDIVLRDAEGHEGHTSVTTLALKSHPTRVNANGCLVDGDGKLYMPLGGFYANWPAGLPGADGTIARSVDLFPCSAHAYPHGFPWTADVEQKVADYLALCRKHGITGLRLMLRNMDLVGRVDPVQLKAVLHLLDLAGPLGIRFNVVLFEDYTKPPYGNLDIIEKIVLPHYTEQELAALPPHRARFLVRKEVLPRAPMRYTDRDAIRCQKDYIEELLPYLADREEVFCYEHENEMVHPPMSWVNEMSAFIREIDPSTPILGNPGPHDWPEPWRWRGSKIDLYSYHPYNNGLPGADHGAVIFMRSKWSAAAGLPMFTGEGGINQSRWSSGGEKLWKAPPDAVGRGIRDQIWLSIACGACGAFMWASEHEAEMAEFGKVVPALDAVGIDLRQLKRRRPRTVVVMPDDASANDKACVIGYQLLSRGVDFDTRPADATAGYAFRIDAVTTDPAQLTVEPEFLKPLEGHQIACLASEGLDQVLVYLRNTAGGIHNHGTIRPCHLREPRPARAGLELVGATRWAQVAAFDLDTRAPMRVQANGNTLLIADGTTHDYVIGLRR